MELKVSHILFPCLRAEVCGSFKAAKGKLAYCLLWLEGLGIGKQRIIALYLKHSICKAIPVHISAPLHISYGYPCGSVFL